MPDRRRATFALVALLALASLRAPDAASAQRVRPAPTPSVDAQHDPRPKATPTPTPTAKPTPTPTSTPSPSPLPPATDPAEASDPTSGDDNALSSSGGNWLARNGLDSPVCRANDGQYTTGGLAPSASAQSRENCARSGIASAPANIDHLGFDIHIDTGLTGLSSSGFALVLQQLMALAWSLLVMVTQGLFAALEWAFQLDLLSPASLGALAVHLQALEQAFTLPMVRIALGLTAAWMAYHAIIHRRARLVAGESVRMFGLLAVALAVIANPVGTVGWLNRTANQAAIAAIGALSLPADAMLGHRATNAQASYEDGLQGMFTGLIVRPWALLEFGDVDWATDPKRLDPRLKQAAIALAAEDSDAVRQQVRVARANGELWLAWPAQSPERNSVKDRISGDDRPGLLRELCGNDDDNDCKAEHAARAEARTETGTLARAAQLLLIMLGLAPVWLLLAVITFMIIGATVMALFHLLQLAVIAPIAVLGWGNGPGRFSRYLTEFAGALFAKFGYALVLGLVLNLHRILASLSNLGFVLQWLLLAIGVVMVIRKRKTAWGMLRGSARHGELGERAAYHARRARRRVTAETGWIISDHINRARHGHRATAARANPPRGGRQARTQGPGHASSGKARRAPPALDAGAHLHAPPQAARRGQEHELLRGAYRDTLAAADAAAAITPELDRRRRRLADAKPRAAQAVAAARTPRERARARRREVSLQRRRELVGRQLAQAEHARHAAAAARNARTGGGFDDEPQQRAAAFLHRQAALPRGAPPSGTPRREHRDYARLAGLAGSAPSEYRAASLAAQLRMRARIDAELHRHAAGHGRQPPAPARASAQSQRARARRGAPGGIVAPPATAGPRGR